MQGSQWLASVLISCLVGIQLPGARQSACVERHPGKVTSVVLAVKGCGGNGAMIPNVARGLNDLGDDVAVSVLKGLQPTELNKPEIVRGILCVIRVAFYSVSAIYQEEDRLPRVTFFLLQYLKEKEIHDEVLEAQINSVEEFVKQQTQTSPDSFEDSVRPGIQRNESDLP
jgi:hypothetical protein